MPHVQTAQTHTRQPRKEEETMKTALTVTATLLAAPIAFLGITAAAAWIVWNTPLVDAEAFNPEMQDW